MKLQTLFEPVSLWQFGGFTVVRTKDQQKLMKRLYNAEVGFDYTNRVIIPKLSQQRDQFMLNARKLKEENKALASGIEAATADKTTKIGLAEGESPAPARGDAQ